MKRLMLLLLLGIFVFSGTELKQLVKFPVLIEHFAEHKAVNQTISFLGFLQMHYLGSDMNDADEERDMQLPFKSYNDNTPLTTHFFHKTIDLNFITLAPKEMNFPFAQQGIRVAGHEGLVWQPPKAS